MVTEVLQVPLNSTHTRLFSGSSASTGRLQSNKGETITQLCSRTDHRSQKKHPKPFTCFTCSPQQRWLPPTFWAVLQSPEATWPHVQINITRIQGVVCYLCKDNLKFQEQQVRSGESKWDRVRPGEIRLDRVRPGESRWDQVRPGEIRWVQVWNQVSPGETRWVQVRPRGVQVSPDVRPGEVTL